jgi:hypothetical protein
VLAVRMFAMKNSTKHMRAWPLASVIKRGSGLPMKRARLFMTLTSCQCQNPTRSLELALACLRDQLAAILKRYDGVDDRVQRINMV